MKRSWLSLVLSVCLSLVVISGWLIINPTIALAASCTASCANGRDVTCNGQTCTAENGVGCTGTINGITSSASCKNDDGDLQ